MAVAADERYALPLAVAILSIADSLEESSSPIVYVLDGGLSQETKGALCSSWPTWLDVRFIDSYPAWLDELPLPGDLRMLPQLSRSMYLRLLIPDLLAEVHGKVLYLDADILALADTKALWHTDLEGYPLAAVQDPSIRVVSSPLGIRNCAKLGLDPQAEYFNSGVLLMDLDLWRAEGLGPRVLRTVQEQQDVIRLPDQDALNICLAGRWKRLDDSWNVSVNEGLRIGALRASRRGKIPYLPRPKLPEQENEVQENGIWAVVPPEGAKILHFAGTMKPWMPEFQHPGYRELYQRYSNRVRGFGGSGDRGGPR